MKITPAITIGIMTRNYGCYVAQAIESVLSQGCDDWELFISDDASTDNTAEVVAPYLSDPRIHYTRHEQNLGQANNWRYLLSQGTAPFITVLHADDYWLPGTLETALGAFQANPELDMLYGNWQRVVGSVMEARSYKVESAHLMSGHEEFRYQVTRHTWLPSASFLSRRVVEATGWPNPTLKMLVDTEYFLRTSLRASIIQAVSEPLAAYRVHSANATAKGASNGLLLAEKEKMPELIASELKAEPFLSDCVNLMRRHNASLIFSEGIGQITFGHFSTGRNLMRRALQMVPNLFLFYPKLLPDFLLSLCGPIFLPVFRILHKRRIHLT